MKKSDLLNILKQLVTDSIVQDVTQDQHGQGVYHVRYIDADKFLTNIKLLELDLTSGDTEDV